MYDNIALVDLDGTLADYAGTLLKDLQTLASPEEPEITNVYDMPDWLYERSKLIKKQPEWWYNLPRIEEGFKVLKLIQDLDFITEILTKGPRRTHNAWSEKLRWCQKEIHDDTNVTITFRKGLVYGKVLFDDFPEYMLEWLEWRKNGLGIMLKNPFNEGFKHKNVIMFDGTNLDEVKRALVIAKQRVRGEELKL